MTDSQHGEQSFEGCNYTNEEPHIAAYVGPPCSECLSRRTVRVGGLRRECQNCGLRGEVRVSPRGCFVESVR
jgi:hypothetical protein